MSLPELLSPILPVAGVFLLGVFTVVKLAGLQARPQPVPVRREGSRRRP